MAKISYHKLPIPMKPYDHRLKALSEIRLDGVPIGTMAKYQENQTTSHGTRGGQGQRSRLVTGWTAKAKAFGKTYEDDTRARTLQWMIEGEGIEL